jgi:hypothetical protein
MSNLDDLPIEYLRKIRLARRTPVKVSTTSQTKKKSTKAPAMSSTDASKLLKELEDLL